MSGGASFKQVIPVIFVADLAAAMAYYVDKLGFQVGFESEWEYNGVFRDGLELHIGKSAKAEVAGHGANLYFMVENLDALREEYLHSGAISPENEIIEQPYGMRELHVEDPFGYRIGFAELRKQ